MDSVMVLWLLSGLSLVLISKAKYTPKWDNNIEKREIFSLNLEFGYFSCQVNHSTDFLQIFDLSKLCDDIPDCFLGSDEFKHELKCTDRNLCHPKCINGVCLEGLCYCNDGFGGKGCEIPDKNECKYRACDVFAHCTNTLGGYFCSCFPGYSGNGFSCQDINECEFPLISKLCALNAECVNLPGNFVCRCKPGYTGKGRHSCTDIDECLEKPCGANSKCINTEGDYRCVCEDGFIGNPKIGCKSPCDGVDCGQHAYCQVTDVEETAWSKCICDQGFVLEPNSIPFGCVELSKANEPSNEMVLTSSEPIVVTIDYEDV